MRRREDLRELAAHEKARLHAPALTPAARRSLTRTVTFLGAEADRMQAAADALIAASPTLRVDRDLLASIPGVGEQTASTVLAELPALDRVPSAQAAAAYAGLAPREYKSGSSVHKKTPAVESRQRSTAEGAVPPDADRDPVQPPPSRVLRSAGGGGQAADAGGRRCMRKLVMICYGVFKNRTPFDPDWCQK